MISVVEDQDHDVAQSSALGSQLPAQQGLREKISNQLGNTLAANSLDISNQGFAQDASKLGKAIEMELYALFGNAGKEYREKFRSLHFNLADPKNPELRSQVLQGKIVPRDLVRKSVHELASSELNKW